MQELRAKNIMNAKIPSAWPRGPHRRAYIPAPKITAMQAGVAQHGKSCNAAARASTGKPTAGSSAVVTACPRTDGVGHREQGEQRGEARR